jgi:hypothetical protein
MIARVMLGIMFLLIVSTFIPLSGLRAEEPVQLKYTKTEIEDKWQVRIQSILAKNVIPLIDLLSFLPRKGSNQVIRWTKNVMDEQGVALMSFAGYWAPKQHASKGHRWDYFIHSVVNADPDRFILTTNKGGNESWWHQQSGKSWDYIDQLEQQVLGGDYPFIGQIEFRHYMSNAQCKAGKTYRDIDIALNGPLGQRIFKLAASTGVPFSIHLEPEDSALAALKQMLQTYPNANVIVSHFGQVRHPERAKKFGPKLIAHLLLTYPNLYFDLSTGEPGRIYKCGDYSVVDTVLWQEDARGEQTDNLKKEYKELLIKFSDRFVAGFDYGPSNRQSIAYLKRRIKNIRLILRDLPTEAKHNIGYRNAWYLLTHKRWQ